MKFLQIITLLTLISVKAFIPDPNLLLKKNLFTYNVDNIVDKNLLKNADVFNFNDNFSIHIVDKFAQSLPNIDSIGHQVILLDRNLVNLLIDNHSISPDLKKNLILLIIKISQEGDQIGTFVLENFYKITDFLL